MDDDLYIEEPTATGWLRAEFHGDTEHARALLHTGRNVLGAMKAFYGINARLAQGEPGGVFRHAVQLPDGSTIEALHNNGHDTLRIHAVPQPVPQERPVPLPLPPVPQEGTVPPPEALPAPAFEEEPPPLRRSEEVRTEEEDEWSNVEIPGVSATLWLEIWTVENRTTFTLREWSLGTRDFTGREMELPVDYDAMLIYKGALWAIFKSVIVVRRDITSGEEQTMYVGPPGGGDTGLLTVTETGVLAMVAPDDAGYTRPVFVQFDEDGQVVWERTYSGGDGIGSHVMSFTNDGTTAYVHHRGGYATRGLLMMDLASGSFTSLNMQAWDNEAPYDDFRMDEEGVYAVVADDGDMYGVRFRTNNDMSGDPWNYCEVFMRSPATAGTSSVLVDVSRYGPRGSPFDPLALRLQSGAVTMTDTGLVLCATDADVVVIDPVAGTTARYDVSQLGVTYNWSASSFSQVAPTVGVIPESSLAVFAYLEKNSTDVFADPTLTRYKLVVLDTDTMLADVYNITGCMGYLLQYHYDDDSAAAPEDELTPEWEYLSRTSYPVTGLY